MSFDLQLYTKRPPNRDAVEKFAADDGWSLALEGGLGANETLAAEVRGLLRRTHLFVMSSPTPAEREDFPDPVSKLIRRGGAVFTDVNLSWGVVGKPEFERCVRLLAHLAETFEGVLFDPQDERVLWPAVAPELANATSPAPGKRAPSEKLIRQLSLEWYLADAPEAVGEQFLELLIASLPEAVPTRFGEFEPMSFKMSDPDGPNQFRGLWRKDSMGFFWKAKSPMLGGSVFWSSRHAPPPGASRRDVISIDVNATAIEGDEGALSRIVTCFEQVAVELGAFYAAGYVTRDVILARNGRVWHGAQTEQFGRDWSGGPWWIGLAAKPVWLAWYGRPYAHLVGPAVHAAGRLVGDGLVVRLGPLPMDTDEARAVAVPLPSELIATFPPVYETVNIEGGPTEMLIGYRKEPAQVVPSSL